MQYSEERLNSFVLTKDIPAGTKYPDSNCDCRQEKQNSKVKELCKFFENIIEQNKKKNDDDDGRTSKSAHIGEALSLGNLSGGPRWSLSGCNVLIKGNQSSHDGRDRGVACGATPKRAISLEAVIEEA